MMLPSISSTLIRNYGGVQKLVPRFNTKFTINRMNPCHMIHYLGLGTDVAKMDLASQLGNKLCPFWTSHSFAPGTKRSLTLIIPPLLSMPDSTRESTFPLNQAPSKTSILLPSPRIQLKPFFKTSLARQMSSQIKLEPPLRVTLSKKLLGKYLALWMRATKKLGLLIKFQLCFPSKAMLKPCRSLSPYLPYILHTHILPPREPSKSNALVRIFAQAPLKVVHHTYWGNDYIVGNILRKKM